MSRVLRSPVRRDLLRAAVLLPATGAAVVGSAALGARPWARRSVPLLSEGVVVGADGAVRPVPPGGTAVYAPGTRVSSSAMGPASASVRASARRRRDGARLPGGRWGALADAALTDLLVLTGPTLAEAGGGDRPRSPPDPSSPGR